MVERAQGPTIHGDSVQDPDPGLLYPDPGICGLISGEVGEA